MQVHIIELYGTPFATVSSPSYLVALTWRSVSTTEIVTLDNQRAPVQN